VLSHCDELDVLDDCLLDVSIRRERRQARDRIRDYFGSIRDQNRAGDFVDLSDNIVYWPK